MPVRSEGIKGLVIKPDVNPYETAPKEVVAKMETITYEKARTKFAKPVEYKGPLGFNPKNLEDPESPKADAEIKKILKKSEIAKTLSEKLNVPIRRGKFRARGEIGIFKPGPKVVRIKAGGLQTIFHEVGHFLDDTIGFSKDISLEERQALMNEYDFKYEGQVKRQQQEAFGEFLRFKMTGQDEKIAQWAPEFNKLFDEKLKTMPEIKSVIDTATVDFKRWNDQPAVAKV